MPSRLRSVAVWGNGTLALFFFFITLILLFQLDFVSTLFCGLVTAFAAFNVYVLRQSAVMVSEEEWLKAEIRKAELRKTLAGYDGTNEVVHVTSPPPAA